MLFGLVLWFVLDSYIDPKTSAQKKDLVQALGLITAGVAGAVGIFFTWRGQRLAREAQEHNQRNTQEQLSLTRQSQEQNQKNTQAQLENAQEELRLTRQGQITERFTRAIEQLGATDDKGEMRLEIRLGGIYALERIDKESPGRDYHSTVMEVLTAYVRENIHQGPGPSKGASEAASTANEATAEEDEGSKQPAPPEPHRPTADIQAILDVLGRAQAHVPVEHRTRLDLHEAILIGADLQKADLQGAILQGADLQGAILQKADLRGAALREADLEGASLQGANLQAALMLTQEQIEWTIGLNETELPEGLNRPQLWSKSIEEQMKNIQERLRGQ